MALKTERRTQNRKRPLSLVYVELPPSNGGMMRDLSEHGFSLRAMMPLSPSEKIPFSFMLDSSARIDGEAIVLRVEDGGHVAALEFAGLPSYSRDQIRRWLDRFEEPLAPESAPAQPNESRHTSLTELRTQIRAPKPPSPDPPVGESAPQSSKIMALAKPEPSLAPPAPAAEIAAPPRQKAATPPNPAPPSAPIPAVLETPRPAVAVAPPKPEPPLPPAAEIPQPPPLPLPEMTALPKPSTPLPQEAPCPPVSYTRVEPSETLPLPPLLRLSSVRPEPLPTDISVELPVTATPAKPVAEPPAKIQISPPKPEPHAPIETRVSAPLADLPAVPRRVPPPLEPLSSFEGETDSDAPGWMDRFTLGRAIGIMLFLTLLAGSYVGHRELGQALIWLGHQIAGDDSPESSKVVLPENPSASGVVPAPAGASRPVVPPSPSNRQPAASIEPKSANLPAATDKTPSPQLKDTAPGSLVPLTQVARPPASAAASSTDNAPDAGQQEYLEALRILRSPSRGSEVPAAIKLLWVAVEKGNTAAEIALAELFRTGKGVAKNCDQTRILLSAAAQKGSTEARKRLEELRREGCSN